MVCTDVEVSKVKAQSSMRLQYVYKCSTYDPVLSSLHCLLPRVSPLLIALFFKPSRDSFIPCSPPNRLLDGGHSLNTADMHSCVHHIQQSMDDGTREHGTPQHTSHGCMEGPWHSLELSSFSATLVEREGTRIAHFEARTAVAKLLWTTSCH